MTLLLASHLSFCLVDAHCIFLDRNSGRYFQLSEHLDGVFRTVIAGPESATRRVDAQPLIEAGIIAVGNGGNGLHTPVGPEPKQSIFDTILPRARLIDIAVLLAREIYVKRALLGGRFGQLIDGVGKSGVRPARKMTCLPSVCAAAHATRLYRSAYDQCLPRSLVLAQTLRQAGHDTRLIIGVTGSPFLAHAWVQQGSTVLNDEVDQVRQFTPILAV